MARRILVLGAMGMLGHVVVKTFEDNGDDVTGISLEKYADNIYAMDVASHEFDRFLHINRYDVVINCVGILNRSAEDDPALAVMLNSYLPHKLEKFYKDTDTRIIHPSTDCVFRGNTGPYTEASPYDGQTYYDRSKALGEIINDKDLTLRMSIIGPEMNENGIGLFNWFMKQKGNIKGFKNAIWTGITTMELARGMVAAVEQSITGLYHYVPSQSISKYEMLVLFAEIFGKTDINIIGVDEPHIDKSLVNTRTDFAREIPDYRGMFLDMRRWMKGHAHLYPHYNTV